jgi:hypothetical protein
VRLIRTATRRRERRNTDEHSRFHHASYDHDTRLQAPRLTPRDTAEIVFPDTAEHSEYG